MLQPAPHILITRLTAIGDCILTLPLATAIKRAMPQARVTWAVACPAKQLLPHCPDIDQIVTVSKRWLAQPNTWPSIRRRLRAMKFDIAIDPQSRIKSASLSWLSGAPVRVGWRAPRGRELAPWLNNRLVQSSHLHLVDAQLDLLQAIGIDSPSPPMVNLRLPIEAKQWADDWMIRNSHGRPLMVINPGATWESKCWPVDRFAAVAAHGVQRGLCPVIVWGDPIEQQAAATIAQQAGPMAIVAPRTDLVQLAALMQRARLCVSGDTGPLHLAAAMGTRTVAIFGPTNPRKCGPYGAGHRVLWADIEANGPRRQKRFDRSYIDAIGVADVCRAVDELAGIATCAA
jgi:heptosyltransferase I